MQRGVGCSRMPDGGDQNKDMGGLLLENDTDFLLYRGGGRRDVEALNASLVHRTEVRVSRHVTNPESTCNEYYYCGFYQVVDSIPFLEEGTDFTYFKLLRSPGQRPLVPQMMVFKHDRIAKESFLSTRQAYIKYLMSQAEAPSEKFSFYKPCGSKDGVFEFDLCVICGIDGNGIDMHYCECCSHNGREVVVHPSCIERNELQWLSLAEHHHWRCSECRTTGQRPPEGLLYEDAAASQRQSLQPTAHHVTVPDSDPAGDVAGTSALPERRTGKRARAHLDPDFVVVANSSEDESSDGNSDDNFTPRSPKCLRTLRVAEQRHPVRARTGPLLPCHANGTSTHQTNGRSAADHGAGHPSKHSVTAISQASEGAADKAHSEIQGTSQLEAETSSATSLDPDRQTDCETDLSDAAAMGPTKSTSSPLQNEQLDATQLFRLLSPGHVSSTTHAAEKTSITDAAAAALSPSHTAVAPSNIMVTSAPAPDTLVAPTAVAAAAGLPPWRTKAAAAAPTVHKTQPASALCKSAPMAAAATLVTASARTGGTTVSQDTPPDAAAKATATGALATAAPLSAASLPASAAASSSPASLSEAVVNLRLMEVSDSRTITPQQVKGLEGSLSGISDFLELDKGDIKDVLRHKSFGIELTPKQALFMQSYILELKDQS